MEEICLLEALRETGESNVAARLRVQEEVHQKASAILSNKVNIVVMSLS